MSEGDSLVHSRDLAPEVGGELLSLSRQRANWEWMGLFVRRLLPGEVYERTREFAWHGAR